MKIATEARLYVLGKTEQQRRLFVVCTIRNNLIRVISARDMNNNEKAVYSNAKTIPNFTSEQAEQQFWSENDSTDYVNWDNAKVVVLPKLKPTMKTISLRLPETMIEQLKLLAHKRDVPYQSLVKIFLAERIGQELTHSSE